MSWFTRKKQNINQNPKKDLPSDLWIKCPNCGEILYIPELEANNSICHHCNFHFPITSERYKEIILDEKSDSIFSEITCPSFRPFWLFIACFPNSRSFNL